MNMDNNVYVLVSQGVEIYRTKNKKVVEEMQKDCNEKWRKHIEKCAKTGDTPVDNEVFLYEEANTQSENHIAQNNMDLYKNNKRKDMYMSKKTLIVCVFPGCGKTWLVEHQKQFGYAMYEEDSSHYKKEDGWELRYLLNVMAKSKSGLYDFIFIDQEESILDEMDCRGIPYVIVEPDNIIYNNSLDEPPKRKKERQLIKQQWMGRLVLKNSDDMDDSTNWSRIKYIKKAYDDKTSLDFVDRHRQVSFFTLNQDQYLSDIIDDLYWKKEHYTVYTSGQD